MNIVDACDLPIEETLSPVPSMRGTLMGTFQPLRFIRIYREADPTTYQVREYERNQPGDDDAMGSIQPLNNRQLSLKPEGERNWKWVKIYSTTDLSLGNGDRLKIGTLQYRIMGDKNWNAAGYFYYEACQGYEEETP